MIAEIVQADKAWRGICSICERHLTNSSDPVFAVLHRCRTIPVISKRMLHVHQQYPPARKQWIITTCPRERNLPALFITHSMVKWLGQICGTLEMLTVVKKMSTDADMLPHLLVAAKAAPKLHNLKILGSSIKSADLCGLAFLRQLQQLSLENCLVEDGPRMHGIHCLSG